MQRSLRFTVLTVVLMLGIATTFKADHGKYFEISKNIEIFTNLYKEVNTYYVDDIDPAHLMRIGVDAMLESLDPYTNYISESEIEGYRYMTEGRYNGIGAQSKEIGDYITVTDLYENQPADKAGLKVGDKIIAVDGKDAVGKTSEDVNNILRGFPGTEVVLTIKRPGEKNPFNVTLMRDEVEVPNVPYSGMVSEDVGYIALTTFTRNAGRNVADALKKLKEENPNLNGVVFDLRGNGGGLLTEAVNICNIFIPKNKVVVTTKGKVKDWDRSFKTLNSPVNLDIPLVVLIDEGSASASEIVSGVIQDYDRGVLMGQQSYGKGLVQNTRDVGYNSRVKMTTAKYYIPSGRCIQAVEYNDGQPVDISDDKRTPFKTRNGRKVLDGGGVKPDVVVNIDGNSNILRTLERENLIFDYVTNYCQDNDEIAALDDFRFTEFDEFVQFLEKRNFDYDTDTEKLLDKLREQAKGDGYIMNKDIEALQRKIIEAKRNDLQKHKDAIVDMIEKEIVSRYYYQIGKIKIGLRNDKEIQDAVTLLHDEKEYNKMLGN